ncbi:TldD/PmbA family protein [Candidatus Phytoplasma prunorum]|uniref:TldD/PmbA family protein n=1 Tax=Candidatus Phytoplasma prunorum TaxID=47565 RepID=UPI002FEE9D74
MLNKKEIQVILNQSLDTGADFAELFFEDTNINNLEIIGQEVINCSSKNIFGVGIRLLQGINEVYGYTNDISFYNILNLVKNLKLNFFGSPHKVIPLSYSEKLIDNIKIPYSNMTKLEKSKKMLNLSKIMKDYDIKIIQTRVNLSEKEQKVLIANTKGVYQNDTRNYISCGLISVAKKDNQMKESYEIAAKSVGLEFFEMFDLVKMAKNVSKTAIILLDAKEIKPQKMSVVINNGFGGVIFHEACGHPLEASSVAKGFSPFVGKINQKIASELVTAYDDGNIKNSWGSLNFDDEGKKTQKNLLIKDGILKNYLVDLRNGREMNIESTGSSRRESYKFSPTSRMNSTYIDAGKDTPQQIIKDTKYGLYAKSLGGGTVVPLTGEFNFVVKEGYLIENGKLTFPVKGAMLIGYGHEILNKIDRVANDLKLSQGSCGAGSGYVPVDVGQPTIRVKEIIVGGTERENC